MLDTLVAIVRLPCSPEPFPKSLDILACNFGSDATNIAVLQSSYLHLSKRVLDAIRTTDTPVMASSGTSTAQNIGLTIVDEHKPHLVFSSRTDGENLKIFCQVLFELRFTR